MKQFYLLLIVGVSYRVCVDRAGHFLSRETSKASGSWKMEHCCHFQSKVRHRADPDVQYLSPFYSWSHVSICPPQSWLTVTDWTRRAGVASHQMLMKLLRSWVSLSSDNSWDRLHRHHNPSQDKVTVDKWMNERSHICLNPSYPPVC